MSIYLKNKNNLYDLYLIFILSLISAWYLMPAVQHYLRSRGFIILAVCFIVLTFFYNKRIILDYFILATLILICMNLIYFGLWNNVDYFTKILSFVYFFFPLFPILFLTETKKYLIQRKIVTLSLIMILFTAFSTLIGLISHPEASRILATSNINLYDISSYQKVNIGGYGFIYALVLSSPIYIYLFKINKMKFFPTLLVMLFIGYIAYIAQYTMAVLFIFLISICCIFLRKLRFSQLILIILVLFTVLFFGLKIVGELFSIIANQIGIEAISTRFQQVSDFLLMNSIESNSDLGMRLELYSDSLTSFFHNPFLGLMVDNGLETFKLGHHSELLDLLGGIGILGLIPLISLLIYFKFKVISKIKQNAIYHYWIWFTIFIFFFILLNTLFSSYELGFVIFLLMPSAVSFEKVDVMQHKTPITQKK